MGKLLTTLLPKRKTRMSLWLPFWRQSESTQSSWMKWEQVCLRIMQTYTCLRLRFYILVISLSNNFIVEFYRHLSLLDVEQPGLTFTSCIIKCHKLSIPSYDNENYTTVKKRSIPSICLRTLPCSSFQVMMMLTKNSLKIITTIKQVMIKRRRCGQSTSLPPGVYRSPSNLNLMRLAHTR